MSTSSALSGPLKTVDSEYSVASGLSDYLELTKPRVTAMVLLTTAVGFHLAWDSEAGWFLFICALLGTGMLAAGTSVLNQFLEREADSRMRRTSGRPLPAGRLSPPEAMLFGMLLVSTGTLYLLLTVNLLTAFLGWFTSTVYLLLYTPLKTKSSWSTLVGAVPGALPPVMGWTAVKGQLDLEAILLFAILFSWQFPHFLAIAWIYKEDYERGGFRMLPRDDAKGLRTGRHILVSSLILVGFSFLPSWLGLAGTLYLISAVSLGLALLRFSIGMAFRPTKVRARRLLRVSVIYLPLLLILLTVDKF